MKRKRALVACETSGMVREALRRRGVDAYSCDLLPADDGSIHHFRGDALEVLRMSRWDLLIAHPPCTHLSVSGAAHFEAKRADGRQQAAIDFFMSLANADVPQIAIENPVCIMSSVWREPDQIIQPHQFGEDASKSTCLWLKSLPCLKHTRRIRGRLVTIEGKTYERWANQTDSGQNALPPSADRWKLRSATYPGIADAMGAQWAEYADLFAGAA